VAYAQTHTFHPPYTPHHTFSYLFCSPSPPPPQERAPTSVAYAENQSMFLDSLARDAAWLGRYARSREGEPFPWAVLEKVIRDTHPYEVFMVSGLARQGAAAEGDGQGDVCCVYMGEGRPGQGHGWGRGAGPVIWGLQGVTAGSMRYQQRGIQ
jgi:hypothetical protein